VEWRKTTRVANKEIKKYDFLFHRDRKEERERLAALSYKLKKKYIYTYILGIIFLVMKQIFLKRRKK